MLKKKMLKALNRHINAEFYSAYLYLAMESYFQSLSLVGFARWMRAQVQEEVYHAMKFYDFVAERGGRVLLDAIAKPDNEWQSPLAAFEHHGLAARRTFGERDFSADRVKRGPTFPVFQVPSLYPKNI